MALCVCEATRCNSPAGVKSLSRALWYSTHAFLVYFPTCITLVLDCKFCLCKKKVAFICTPFLSFPPRFEVFCEKDGVEKKTAASSASFSPCGIKLHFEGVCCHASHTRRSRETNRARFIKQRELLCRMGNAGC